MTHPSAGIVLCTFNGAQFLEPQLASILRQSHQPDEVLISDDGSTDETLAIVEQFAAGAPFPVRVIQRTANLGYRANFVTTAAALKSETIFFSDQDDVWHRDKLKRMMSEFARDPHILLSYHNAAVVNERGQKIGPLLHDTTQREVLACTPLEPWHYTLGFTQAFRRELLEHQDLWTSSRDHMSDNVMAHDQWFIFLAALLGRVTFVNQPLVQHRQHATNTYGVQAVPRWRRLTSRFSHNPDWDCLAATAADSRAFISAALAEKKPALRPRLLEVADGYRALAQRHRRRHTAYTAPSVITRASALLDALRGGDYRGRPWGLSGKAMARDLIAAPLHGSSA